MKKIVLPLVVIAFVLVGCKKKKEKVAAKEAVKVAINLEELNNIDVATSVLNWKGTKPTGSHNGTVALKRGSILLEDGKLSKGEFIIDMTSIKVLDIPADKKANGQLVGHLTNEDFFDIVVYPTSKFVITSIQDNGEKINVTGNLSIKDITKSITIPATIFTKNGVTTFKSDTFLVNRADFNVKYGSKSFFDNLKDKFIDDNIEFSFVVKTKS